MSDRRHRVIYRDEGQSCVTDGFEVWPLGHFASDCCPLPGGGMLYAAEGDGPGRDLYRMAERDGPERVAEGAGRFALHRPTGKLLFLRGDGLYCMDADLARQGEEQLILEQCGGFALSMDGRHILCKTRGGRLVVSDGRSSRVLPALADRVSDMLLMPGGGIALLARREEAGRYLICVDAVGARGISLSRGPYGRLDCFYRRDGGELYIRLEDGALRFRAGEGWSRRERGPWDEGGSAPGGKPWDDVHVGGEVVDGAASARRPSIFTCYPYGAGGADPGYVDSEYVDELGRGTTRIVHRNGDGTETLVVAGRDVVRFAFERGGARCLAAQGVGVGLRVCVAREGFAEVIDRSDLPLWNLIPGALHFDGERLWACCEIERIYHDDRVWAVVVRVDPFDPDDGGDEVLRVKLLPGEDCYFSAEAGIVALTTEAQGLTAVKTLVVAEVADGRQMLIPGVHRAYPQSKDGSFLYLADDLSRPRNLLSPGEERYDLMCCAGGECVLIAEGIAASSVKVLI